MRSLPAGVDERLRSPRRLAHRPQVLPGRAHAARRTRDGSWSGKAQQRGVARDDMFLKDIGWLSSFVRLVPYGFRKLQCTGSSWQLYHHKAVVAATKKVLPVA
ncbi:hypothetical protein BS78_08G120900 [Paspalum vaginatum]|nr:hypothetical protein BS78_08G120900 [Paspalum vaginatum]KAJ1266043.1 hypothetical protein BS78_08G120900 [Paspalum vaginatum]KAJ1266044.1 hypothetical protein BS78_08G120900 [Paspalum vaginatum]